MNGRVSYLQGIFTKNLHLQAVFSLVKMKTSMGPQDQDGCASKTPAPQRSTLDKVMSVKAWTNIGVRFWLNKSLRWIDSSFLDFFFVCSFQLFFGVDAKWEMRWLDYIVTLFKQKRKKSATNLLPGVQESAEASESGIPFDLHMINSRSCPSPHPNWPKERMANKKREGGEQKRIRGLFSCTNPWKTGEIRPSLEFLAEAPGGSFLTPLNGCASSEEVRPLIAIHSEMREAFVVVPFVVGGSLQVCFFLKNQRLPKQIHEI